MKKILMTILIFSSASMMASADTYVQGYCKGNGTCVQGHYRSDADNSVNNNWSTKGNVNPYTGKSGTKKRSSW